MSCNVIVSTTWGVYFKHIKQTFLLHKEKEQVKTTLTKLIQKSENTTRRLRISSLNCNITVLMS